MILRKGSLVKRLRCLATGVMLVLAAQGAMATVVTGTVTDAQTGEPLVGASVMVVGTQQGVVTDLEGHYSIALLEGKYLFCGRNCERA